MAAQLPPTSTKSIQVGDVSSADIEEYRGDSRERMTVPDMMGKEFQHMESSRYDGQARGYSSDNAYIPATEPAPHIEQPAYQEQAAPIQEEPNYQQRYGQALNEMGEWRKVALQNQQLLEQMAEINNRLSQPQPQTYQGPPQPPQRLFPDRPPGELLTWGEMEAILRDEVIPTIEQRANLAASQAQDGAAAQTQRMLPTWDVQPQEESQAVGSLRSEFYNFDQRFTQVERNAMIRKEVARLRSQSGNVISQRPTATPIGTVQGTAPILVDPSRAMRRATYIESAPPAQMTSEPSAYTDPKTAIRNEINALDQEYRAKTGRPAPATAMKAILERYGIGEANDFGSGVSTR